MHMMSKTMHMMPKEGIVNLTSRHNRFNANRKQLLIWSKRDIYNKFDAKDFELNMIQKEKCVRFNVKGGMLNLIQEIVMFSLTQNRHFLTDTNELHPSINTRAHTHNTHTRARARTHARTHAHTHTHTHTHTHN